MKSSSKCDADYVSVVFTRRERFQIADCVVPTIADIKLYPFQKNEDNYDEAKCKEGIEESMKNNQSLMDSYCNTGPSYCFPEHIYKSKIYVFLLRIIYIENH